MSAPTIPVRLANGLGNPPLAENWMDDYDWITGFVFGLAFITNGGFELWTAGTTFTNPSNGTTLADNWVEVKSGTSGATADVTRESTTVDSGTYSMKVNITGAGSSDSIWGIKQSVLAPTAFGALTVLAGVKVKVSTANKVRIKVYDGTTTTYSSYHTGDGTWQLLQAKATLAATPSEVTVTIEINPSNFTGAVYIDSAYLYVVPAAISTRAQQALTFTPLSAIGYLPTSGGTMSGVIAMGGNKITGLANGTVATDAAAFGQVPVITAMTIQRFTSGSGTYTKPTGPAPLYLIVRMLGGGGGGSGGGSSGGGAGSDGGDTTFGSATAGKGIGGVFGDVGGAGGANTTMGTVIDNTAGGSGQGRTLSNGTNPPAAIGGASRFAGGARKSTGNSAGTDGVVNTGEGGQGGGGTTSAASGSGGGAGGYMTLLITSPSSTYSYGVGAGGAGGSGGTGGNAGGAGGSGIIIVEEHYQ